MPGTGTGSTRAGMANDRFLTGFRLDIPPFIVHFILNNMNVREQGPDAIRAEIEREVVDIFVRLGGLLGLPRSIGELYGLLYIIAIPLPMDELMKRLQLSKGATSQGLKVLRQLGAVTTVYVSGDRRDHFAAVDELRPLVDGFLRGQVLPHLENGANRMGRLRELARSMPNGERGRLVERVTRLAHWHRRADRLLPWALKFIRH